MKNQHSQKLRTVALRARLLSVVLLIVLLTAGRGSGQALLDEQFNYTNGTALTANGWTAHSTGVNPITVTNPATISYTGYPGSGTGGEVTMAASGEDINRTFTQQTSGTVYFSFIANFTAANLAGDYFFHVGATSMGTTFRGRIWAKRDASNNLFFGISHATSSSSSVVYTTGSYALNTTYLIVMKYEFIAGTNNDLASIYINPPLNAPVPATGWVTCTDLGDIANVGTVALRQGNSTNAPTLKLDGIRVSTNWEDIVGSAAASALIASPNILNGFSYLEGAGPSASQSYNLSGNNLSNPPGEITVTGTTNFEVSLDNSTFSPSVTVLYATSTLAETPVYVRMKSGLALGSYYNENIINTGGGANPVNVTCNGAVILGEPTNHATGFLAGTTTATTIPLTWTDAVNGIIPTAYLVKASATSFDAIAAPVDFVPETDGLLVKNVTAGTQAVTFTGLQPNSTYYFKIFPYTNAGVYANYKTDGSVPQVSAATTILHFRSLASGAWNAPATWEITTDNTNWNPATTEVPVYRTSDVTILNGHQVTVPLSYNLGAAEDLTVQTGGTLFANISTGSCFVYVYGNILNNGTIGGATDVIGFDIEGPSCLISGTGSFNASRMAKFTTFSAVTNLTIGQNINLSYTSVSSPAMSNGQSGTTLFNIAVAPGKQLRVSNAGINLNGCTLTLQGDATGSAALLDNGVTGTGASSVVVQRYIGGWTSPSSGWHLLSSPVAAQAVSPAFTDAVPGNYDFYKWSEPTDEWLNQKVGANNITAFEPGVGYLVAYQNGSTRQFTGTLNTADVLVSNLTMTPGTYMGWNLLGNPFATAIKWNDGVNWTVPADIAAIAKVWNESNASYSDIAPNGNIPAMNGFMVQVISGAPLALTIPKAARVLDNSIWYKTTDEKLMLVAYDRDGQTAQECVIGAHPESTAGYEPGFDSRFLPGYAPSFYALAGTERLSTTTLPSIDETRVIELGFEKNASAAFSIGIHPESTLSGYKVYLTDRKTSAVTELSSGAEYSFTAAGGDDPGRFQVHFGALGIGDPQQAAIRVYAHGGMIYFQGPGAIEGEATVAALTGQVVAAGRVSGTGLTAMSAGSLPSGIYLVSLVSGSGKTTAKVMVR